MRSALVWTVRFSALVGWIAAAVACAWLLGVGAVPRPWTGPLVWGGVAAGCAVVRAGALWGLRRKPGVVLEKPRTASLDEVLGFSFDAPGWVRARTGALGLLVVFACAALFVGLMTTGSGNERIVDLRDAGAELSTATVVERPRAVREDRSEDVVRGYTSRLVVAVPGGPERLAVKGAYTQGKPRRGTEVEVLWARSAPELGGYVHERESLRTLAASRWEAFPDGANGRDALVAFVLVMVVGGVITLIVTCTAGPRALQRVAWSAPVQTVPAVLIAAVFLGRRPVLLGQQASVAEGVSGFGGFVLLCLVYLFTLAKSIGED